MNGGCGSNADIDCEISSASRMTRRCRKKGVGERDERKEKGDGKEKGDVLIFDLDSRYGRKRGKEKGNAIIFADCLS
jgi:hypothetical protein